MIRWTARVVSVVVLVFSISFVLARWTAPDTPARSQLVVTPAPPDAPLRVRTLRGAPKLPGLRPPPAAVPSPPPPVPAPSPVSAPPPAASSASVAASAAPPVSVMRARVPWPTLPRR